MKIYLITREPYPNGMAATSRINCFAHAIIQGGLECEIIICCGTEVRGGKIKNYESEGRFEGVPFRYIGGSPSVSNYRIPRLISQYYRLLRVRFFLNAVLKKGDIIFLVMNGRVNTMLRFQRIAHKKGAYCVRDFCELPFGTGTETERSIRLRKEVLDKQFPRLDGIISISDALMNLAKTYTNRNCKHIKIPILVDCSQYGTHIEPLTNDIPYIFHAGTLNEQKDGILGMIEAFGLAREELNTPVKFIMTGEISLSSQASTIRSLIHQYHLEDSIVFVGYLFRNQVNDYLSRASLVISNRPRSKQDYYGFSTKVGEYLASGTPLITTCWGEVTNWLKDGESAFIIEPENTRLLADTIIRVINKRDESRIIGKNGRNVCRDSFDYRVWVKPLHDFLMQLGK